METAIEYGERNCASDEELTQIRTLPLGTTQADWYENLCPRGDWMWGQLDALPLHIKKEIKSTVEQSITNSINQAIETVLETIIDIPCVTTSQIFTNWSDSFREWAEKWLDGSDRTKKSAQNAANTGITCWHATEDNEEDEVSREGFRVASAAVELISNNIGDSVTYFLGTLDFRELISEWPGQ